MGTTLDLASGSHRILLRTQEPPSLALSDKNLQSAPRWLSRSLEGLEEESLAEFPETIQAAKVMMSCDQESCFHSWGAPASLAARGHRPLSMPASGYQSLPLSQIPNLYLLEGFFLWKLESEPRF